MLWVLGFGVVVAVVAADNNQVPKTGFSCDGRTTGYYADVTSGCQVYHMCDGLGRQFSYTCPNATLFQQRMLICDHWYMVNCSKSEDDYAANLRIGQKEMPFVDDSESHPYYRTPRPDLLAHHSQSEYDIIYRTGRAQYGTNLNLVGAESDKNSTPSSTTDEPTYSLPSHWSTEYNQQGTTSKPNKVFFNKKNIDASNIKGKPRVPIVPVTEIPVNFKSFFKATTPVYPKTVDATSAAPDEVGLVPPLPYQVASGANTEPESTESSIFSEPLSSVGVNFESHFKATTPVYPTSVDITSEEPAEAGILPPVGTNGTSQEVPVPSLSVDFVPPPVDPNFNPANRTNETQAVPPSKFYQPPKFEPDYTDLVAPSIDESQKREGGIKALNSNEWEDLRKKFLIPDYEFPLESVSRPSYDSVLSSFQASEVPSKKK